MITVKNHGAVICTLENLQRSNPIISQLQLRPTEILLEAPLSLDSSLRSEILLLRGIELPEPVETELLASLLLQGPEGKAGGIIRSFWMRDLRVLNLEGRNGHRRARLRGVVNSMKEFLNSIAPGLSSTLTGDHIDAFKGFPASATAQLYPQKDSPLLPPEEQLERMREILPGIIQGVRVNPTWITETLFNCFKDGGADVQEAVSAFVLRYLNPYYETMATAERLALAIGISLDNFSPDLLVHFHHLVEQYNLTWAISSFEWITPGGTPLMRELEEIITAQGTAQS